MKTIEPMHLEALRRVMKSSREGCDLSERFPPPSAELRAKVEQGVQELHADLQKLEELTDILLSQLLGGRRASA